MFAAGDLADPHSTQRICWDIISASIKELKSESFLSACLIWLFRGGFNNWDLHNIDMAVPMSPSQINHKTSLIHLHHSQLDQLLFLEEDDIGFWSRTANLNRLIAKEFNFLGMSEYEGIEVFKRF